MVFFCTSQGSVACFVISEWVRFFASSGYGLRRKKNPKHVQHFPDFGPATFAPFPRSSRAPCSTTSGWGSPSGWSRTSSCTTTWTGRRRSQSGRTQTTTASSPTSAWERATGDRVKNVFLQFGSFACLADPLNVTIDRLRFLEYIINCSEE